MRLHHSIHGMGVRLSGWIIALSIIALYGLFLRASDLGLQSLWIDEGYTINAAFSILEKGYPILDSGSFYRNGIFSSYLASLSIGIFDFDPYSPWAARLPAVVFGFFLIPASYFLYRELFKERSPALTVSFVVAFSYWELAWSRQARGYVIASFFITLSILFLFRYVRSQRLFYMASSLVCLGLAYISQESALALVPAYICVIAGSRLTNKVAPVGRKVLITSGIALGIVAILCALETILPLNTSLNKLGFMRHLPADLALFSLGLAAATILGALDRKRFETAFFLPLLLIVSACTIIFFSPAAQSRYLFLLYVPLAIAAVYAIHRGCELAFPKAGQMALGILCPCIVLLIAFPHLHFFPSSHYWLERGSPQPDFGSVFRLISAQRLPGDVIVSPYAQLHQIYLGEKGLWLKMNLNGRPENVEDRVVDGRDYYVAAPIVPNLGALQELIARGHGFVVIDSMTKRGVPGIFPYLENDKKVQRIYHSDGQGVGSSVYLYRF